ncbi:MAG: hypothetical protein ACRDN9_20960 [Streptosporangiaceae bacterium]
MGELKRYRWSGRAVDVPFVFGAVGASALSGTVLVRVLGELGAHESAARNLLVRMRDMGILEVERRGRVAVYRINAESMQRYRQVEGTAEPPVWPGFFHAVVYDVPEKFRRLRDRLQHTARGAGYGQLRPGVLITVGDRWSRLRLTPEDFPPGTWFQRVRLAPADRFEARAMTARAFDLPGLAHRYAVALATCERAPRRVEPSWDALRRWRALYTDFFAAMITDPYLPEILLPAGWPGDPFRTAQLAVNERIGNVVQPFLRATAMGLDPQGLCEYYRAPWAHPARDPAEARESAGRADDAEKPHPRARYADAHPVAENAPGSPDS